MLDAKIVKPRSWDSLPGPLIIGTFKKWAPGARFSKLPITFRAPKPVLCLHVCIQDQSFNNFENVIMKLSVNRQNWPACEIETVLLFNRFWFQNLPSDPKSYRAFRETGPTPEMFGEELKPLNGNFLHYFCWTFSYLGYFCPALNKNRVYLSLCVRKRP